MKNICTLEYNENLKDALSITYQDMVSLLKSRNPEAKWITEDKEICQLHDLLALLKLGHIDIY